MTLEQKKKIKPIDFMAALFVVDESLLGFLYAGSCTAIFDIH